MWILNRQNPLIKTIKTIKTASYWYSTKTTNQFHHIEKILIANRGEIACRVMRTARRLGVKTVAIYSDADAESMHVSLADEAYRIGPPPATQSYLRGDKILQIAHKSNCQAIHPGYGFLSENVEFAESCQKFGVVFIGPPSAAIRDMGIKSKSKEIMSNAGVPIIAGYHGKEQSIEKLKEEAKKIGYPIMIKAVRGGGGKGMRIVNHEGEFEEALESAKSESRKAFNDDVVLLEKFIGEPRHVEVQIFADHHGNVVHLFERDCSVQRRHQKIIEEAPAPELPLEVRRKLGIAAVQAAKAVNYVGAGTVEFILDRKTHDFHFMEMNTRLQVEHPVTEMITATDLVEWQIRIANGEELPLKQEEIRMNGHAFEARIYAENPDGGFLPGAGRLTYLSTPQPRVDVRIETGVRQDDEVSIHYDPMIAKLVVWGQNRQQALSKLEANLLQYNIAGLETNVNFLLDLCRHREFKLGHVHTNFIKDNYETLFKKQHQQPDHIQLCQAGLGLVLYEELQQIREAVHCKNQYTPFLIESGFRPNYQLEQRIKLKSKQLEVALRIKHTNSDIFHISTDDGKTWSTIKGEFDQNNNNNNNKRLGLKVTIDGVKKNVDIFIDDDNNKISTFDDHGRSDFDIDRPQFSDNIDDTSASSGDLINKAIAPMPGVIDKIHVKVGDHVKAGDNLFVLIAMKMEYVVKANRNATVSNINYNVGDNVQKDAIIVQFADNTD